MRLRMCLLLALFSVSRPGLAAEELVRSAVSASGGTVPYILDSAAPAPAYVLILFPGGDGVVDPHIEGGKLQYAKRGNFLLRARPFFVDAEFATATTDSTQLEERIQAVIDDLKRRFPQAKIYLVGTSNGTFDTMKLADYLADKIAGEVHTSSLRGIASFDGRRYGNRHLVVHHRQDGCRATPYAAAESSQARYGTELITMEGGISVGNPCEPYAHHGYNGIERETAAAIKRWIRRDNILEN